MKKKKNEIFQTGTVAEAWVNSSFQRERDLPQSILVVDENPLICQLNSEVLIDSGYQVDTAEDAATAWSALLVNNYDLLRTNNDLPLVSGVDLLTRVHATRMFLL
jgi:CheY-like chemotaxis protein